MELSVTLVAEPGGNLVPQGCPIALAAVRNPWNPKPAKQYEAFGGPIDTGICARILSAQKAPETFVGANDLALV